MREATVCRPDPPGRKCLSLPVHLGVLLAGLAGAACNDERRPGVLIEVKVEDADLVPQVVQFDWMAPGQPVLVRGELTPYSRASDPTFFGSLFIETRGPIESPRVIALQGRLNDGEIVSGSQAAFPPSFDEFRSYAILLGQPLPDSDLNGLPDVVERCTMPGAEVTCAETTTDAGAPPTPDAAVQEIPDAAPPTPDAATPDTSPDARDASADATDGGADAGPG